MNKMNIKQKINSGVSVLYLSTLLFNSALFANDYESLEEMEINESSKSFAEKFNEAYPEIDSFSDYQFFQFYVVTLGEAFTAIAYGSKASWNNTYKIPEGIEEMNKFIIRYSPEIGETDQAIEKIKSKLDLSLRLNHLSDQTHTEFMQSLDGLLISRKELTELAIKNLDSGFSLSGSALPDETFIQWKNIRKKLNHLKVKTPVFAAIATYAAAEAVLRFSLALFYERDPGFFPLLKSTQLLTK